MPAFAGHTTGRADRPHPALGQDLTPSSTTRRVATESFWSRLPAAVRPCGSAAELIGRRVKLFGLGRIWITRWPRESRRRGRPRRGRFRHAPGGRRSRDGEGRSARLARYGATTRGGDQLFQPGALIALEQFDHACDLRALAGRRRCWRGRCAPGRRHICCGLRFDKSSFVFGETAVLGMDCEPRSSAGMAFSPATVNFNEYAWPVSSSRRQISIPDLALISLTRPAFRSLVATFCAAAALRVFGGMRQRSLRCDASNKIARCVSVSLAGELIRIILSVLAALSPSPPRAPNRRRAGRGRRIRRSFHRRVTPAGDLSALEHVTTIAVERDESE